MPSSGILLRNTNMDKVRISIDRTHEDFGGKKSISQKKLSRHSCRSTPAEKKDKGEKWLIS